MLRGVAEILLATCITSPISGSRGGTATSQPIFGRKKRQTGNFNHRAFSTRSSTKQTFVATSQPTLPRSIEIDIYLQDAFHGPANQTCAWGIVSSHQGNVGQCPASNAPATPTRPPDRDLLEGSPVPSGAPEAIIYFNYTSNITVAAPSVAPTGSTAVSLAYSIASSSNPTASVPNPAANLPNSTANLGGSGCLIAC